MFERCLYFNTNLLSRMVNTIWQEAYAELKLAPAHAYLLRLALEQPGLAQCDIAAELGLDKSTITRFVNKMVEAGYLRRDNPSDGNRKTQCIYPTEQAQEIATRLNAIGDELYQKMQQTIGNENLTDLISNLRLTTHKI